MLQTEGFIEDHTADHRFIAAHCATSVLGLANCRGRNETIDRMENKPSRRSQLDAYQKGILHKPIGAKWV